MDTSYEEQLAFIRALQRAVLKSVPHKSPLPDCRPREPKDVYENRGKYGACCERSRLIEKTLRSCGYTTRHIFVYSKRGIRKRHPPSWKWWYLWQSNIDRHSVSEVHTNKGWLVVDSNSCWLSLDKQDKPYSMKDMQSSEQISWKDQMDSEPGWDDLKKICDGTFYFHYGIYCRTGRLYPPFWFRFRICRTKIVVPSPDMDIREFLQNFYCPNLPRIARCHLSGVKAGTE